MNDQTYFRLLHLPGELVEYVSFFFFPHEAQKLLTVSSAFHVLFSKRAWWWLDRRVFTLPEPTRSMAIARYSKLVRLISLDDETLSAIKSVVSNDVSIYNVLSVFSCVTILVLVDRHSLASNGIEFKDLIMCFPNLYNLNSGIEDGNEHYDLVTQALAINHRQNHCGMRPLEFLSLVCSGNPDDKIWTRLSQFVQMVMWSRVTKIRIRPMFNTHVLPSQSELQALSKHLTCAPSIKTREDAQFCYAALNRSLFWRPIDLYNSCFYPHIRLLSIRTCCVSSDTYNYCDFTPVNYPSLQGIHIKGYECCNMASNSYPPAWKKVLLQSWPHVEELTLSINMTFEQLVDILEYHHKLTYLGIWLQPKMLDENSTFNLASILPLLPKLQDLVVMSKNRMRLDYTPNYDDGDVLNQSNINFIRLDDLELSSSIYKLLYSLPKLDSINIRRCQFYSTGIGEVTNSDSLIEDPNEIDMVDNDDDQEDDVTLYKEWMSTLNIISAKSSSNNPCSITQFDLMISVDDYDWPLDFTLEMIALMPELRTLAFAGETDDIPKAVKGRFPFIDIKKNFILNT